MTDNLILSAIWCCNTTHYIQRTNNQRWCKYLFHCRTQSLLLFMQFTQLLFMQLTQLLFMQLTNRLRPSIVQLNYYYMGLQSTSITKLLLARCTHCTIGTVPTALHHILTVTTAQWTHFVSRYTIRTLSLI